MTSTGDQRKESDCGTLRYARRRKPRSRTATTLAAIAISLCLASALWAPPRVASEVGISSPRSLLARRTHICLGQWRVITFDRELTDDVWAKRNQYISANSAEQPESWSWYPEGSCQVESLVRSHDLRLARDRIYQTTEILEALRNPVISNVERQELYQELDRLRVDGKRWPPWEHGE
jgi:hypothetical protein